MKKECQQVRGGEGRGGEGREGKGREGKEGRKGLQKTEEQIEQEPQMRLIRNILRAYMTRYEISENRML
jgi:hypothetical protein